MTRTTEHAPAASWTEPDGIAPRGTLIVIPGRGEQPELYERFGRRIASDGYRVHAELATIAGGRHDTLNDITHRTVAATIVMFLERLRLGSDLPTIAVSESLGR